MYLQQCRVSTHITLPPANQKLYMSSKFFWESTLCIVVIPWRPLRQGPTVCSICHNKPRNIAEERRSPLLRGGIWNHVSAVCPQNKPPHAPCHTRCQLTVFPAILVVLFLFFRKIFLSWVVSHLVVLRHITSISKIVGVFFATNIYVFTLHWLFWISFIPIKKSSTCMLSLLMALLFEELCCICWYLFTKQKESSAASANLFCAFEFSTVRMVSTANLLQPGSYRKSQIFWLHSEVLIITEALSTSAVRMARSALIISELSAFLSVKFVWGGAASKYITLIKWSLN